MDVHGFPEDNIDLLMDDGIHINPTKSNIIDAFKKLVELTRFPKKRVGVPALHTRFPKKRVPQHARENNYIIN